MGKCFPTMALLLLLTGCGGIIDAVVLDSPEETEQSLFEAGVEAMQLQEYDDAVEYFQEIKENYPFSEYVVEAELNYGDALFLDGQYLFAADAYRDFENLHPRHEALPYVLYQVVRSMRNSYTSMDKATTNLEMGLLYAKRIVAEYPNSKYAVLAKEEIVTMRTLIAKRELFIANIYWNMDNPESAWYRYIRITKEYKDLPEIQKFAKKRSEEAYLAFRKKDSEKHRESREGTWKNMLRWL